MSFQQNQTLLRWLFVVLSLLILMLCCWFDAPWKIFYYFQKQFSLHNKSKYEFHKKKALFYFVTKTKQKHVHSYVSVHLKMNSYIFQCLYVYNRPQHVTFHIKYLTFLFFYSDPLTTIWRWMTGLFSIIISITFVLIHNESLRLSFNFNITSYIKYLYVHGTLRRY